MLGNGASGHSDCGLILIKLQEGFFVAISISLLGGLVLSFPIIGFQMWRFVARGCTKPRRTPFYHLLSHRLLCFFLAHLLRIM